MRSQLKIGLLFTLLLFSGLTLAHKKKAAEKPKAPTDPVVITVRGIRDQTILKNVNIALKTLKAKHITRPITQISVLRVYKESPQVILNAIKPFGYFSARITSQHNTFAAGVWHSTFYVMLGPPTLVKKVNIEVYGSGKGDQNFLKIIDHYPIKVGKVLLTQEFQSGNDLLFGHAANLGYFKAKMLEAKMYVNLVSHTARILVRFDTGIRHRFGKTTFSTTPLHERFLRKYLAYKIGQPYLSSKVNETQTRLSAANYFNQVVVTPDIRHSVNGITPIRIQLKMRKRKSYVFGAGYSTDTGPRGTVGFIYRWVNGYGHYFDAKAQGSFVNNYLQIAYHVPWPNPFRDLFTYRIAAGKLDIAAGKSTSAKFAIDYTHHYTTWQHTVSLNFLNERYDIDKNNFPKTRAKLIYPSVNVTYYSTKNHITPAQGMRLTFDVAGTPSFLSSTDGFYQFRTEGKTVLTFFKHLQLVNRAEFGYTHIRNLNSLPLSLQLLTGGTQSIRGFKYQGIGPGKKLFVLSAELRQRVWKELYLSGFYDEGNAASGRLFHNIARSAGPGIVFRSPIGVIGVYAAWRLSKHKRLPAFVFSMGPEL